jgi:PAS domain S-box-containing protein/putative nucleotidyltransferase with HDIG domain
VEHYTDITVRKRLEASLQESEEQFRFVAESAADAIIIGDGEGKVVFWNKAAQEIFGYTAEEIVGRSIALLMPERFRKNFLERMEQLRKTGEVPGTIGRMIQTGLRKDGSEFPAEISYAAWKGGDEMFSTAIIRDITERMAAEKALKDSYEKLERTLKGIVEALGAAIELRDPYTAGHQRRVAELAVAIAEEMGLPTEKVEATRYAALVHDIGKLAVPAEILAKPAALTDTEFALIKFHPQQAYDILKEIDFPWPLAEIVLQHHERLDGSGYPSGLKGDEILLEARIIAVADVVEAMSSHRPYRPARGIEAACDEIKAKRGRLYDPDVVDACVSLFEKGFSFA